MLGQFGLDCVVSPASSSSASNNPLASARDGQSVWLPNNATTHRFTDPLHAEMPQVQWLPEAPLLIAGAGLVGAGLFVQLQRSLSAR